MDQNICRAVLPLVNDIDKYPLLQQYVEYRIDALRGYLEHTKDMNKISEIQGAIAELRRFQTLKEQAVEGAK